MNDQSFERFSLFYNLKNTNITTSLTGNVKTGQLSINVIMMMYNQLINEWKHLSAPNMSCWASFIRIRNAIIKSAVSGLLSDKLQGLHTSLPQPQLSPPLSISINSWLHRAGSPGMGCGLCQRWSWHHYLYNTSFKITECWYPHYHHLALLSAAHIITD